MFEDLYSLVWPYGWLSDNIVSAVINFMLKDKMVGFIEVSLLNARFWAKALSRPFQDNDGYIAVKNINKINLVFAYVSLKDKTMYILDPQHNEVAASSRQIFEAFIKNHHNKENSEKQSKWNFNSGVCNMEYAAVEHSLQKDDCNCGIFCIKYALEMCNCFLETPSKLFVDECMNVARQMWCF